MTMRVVLGAALLSGAVLAQGQTNREYYNGRLRASPHEVHEFDAGSCHISINYGRPSKRGRDIWGGLVHWDRWWMPGADEATLITTSKAIVLGDLPVPAGTHSLYFWPSETKPQLIVNNQTGQFHTQYDQRMDLGRVNMTVTKLSDPVEQLTFDVEAKADGGMLSLSWDQRRYSASFVSPAGDVVVLKSRRN